MAAINNIGIFKEIKYIFNTFLMYSLISVFGSLLEHDPREQGVGLDSAGSPR